MKKQKAASRPDDIDAIGKVFEKFANQYQYQYSYSDIFVDVLDTMLYIATAGKEFQKEYEKARDQYGAQPLRDLIDAISEYSADFNDALGTIYEYIVITKGKSSALGQYFTPQPIAYLMANIVDAAPDKENSQTLADPCGCGSGRMMLAGAMMYGNDRWRHYFYGCDVDLVCIKMTTLNCWLNTMPAFIVHGNGLELSIWGAYEVILNWEADPQADGGGRWLPFVVKQSSEICKAAEAMQKKDFNLKVVFSSLNEERIKRVEEQRRKGGIQVPREYPTISPVISPISEDNTPTDIDTAKAQKVRTEPKAAPIAPTVAPTRKGKEPTNDQPSLF